MSQLNPCPAAVPSSSSSSSSSSRQRHSKATLVGSRCWAARFPTCSLHPGTTATHLQAAAARSGGEASTSAAAGGGMTRVKETIGFIGAGQMGEALIRGFLSSGVSSAGRICASVRTFERRDLLESLGIGNIHDDALAGGAQAVAAESDIIFVGVKPQAMHPVLRALAPHVTPRHLVVSLAAGVKIGTIEGLLGGGARVVRMMPNTPCLVQAGASAYALGSAATPRDADLVHALLSSVGLAVSVEEKMMDAVTGLSGSGPAYGERESEVAGGAHRGGGLTESKGGSSVCDSLKSPFSRCAVYMMIDAMADGGVAAGLPRDTALALAAKTVAGAAQMVLNGDTEGSILGEASGVGVMEDRHTPPPVRHHHLPSGGLAPSALSCINLLRALLAQPCPQA